MKIYVFSQRNTQSKGLDVVHFYLESERSNTNYVVTSFPSSYEANLETYCDNYHSKRFFILQGHNV